MTHPASPPNQEPTRRVDAVVLAGGINRIPLFPGNLPGRKALVPLAGRPLIAYVLDALVAAEGLAAIRVVAPPEVLEVAAAWERVVPVPDSGSLIGNVRRGLEAADTPRVLFCNPDQPHLRPEMVEDFLQRALAVDAEIVSSWVRGEDLSAYPEGAHKTARFGDGVFAHGNLFLVARRLLERRDLDRFLDRLYAARKSNLRFARELGPALLGRFLVALVTGRLPSLNRTLGLAGHRFGVSLAGVVCPYPEIALDVDEPEDYAAAAAHLSRRSAG